MSKVDALVSASVLGSRVRVAGIREVLIARVAVVQRHGTDDFEGGGVGTT